MKIPKSTAPTIIDVAARAGVSRATASRAMGNYGRIAQETVLLVRKAADELGYRPNQVARAMRQGNTKTLGLVVIADFTNAFFDRATKAIVDAAKARGYQVLITNTDEDIQAERQAVETLLEKQVDGFIVVPSPGSSHKHLLKKSLGGKPVVLIDRKLSGINATSVITDDFSGADKAVRHAASMGHQRLGFLIAAAGVKGFSSNQPSELISCVEDRVNGFAEGAKSSGIKEKQQQWIFCEDLPSAEEAINKLLDSVNAPSVIFTSNNDMALAVLKVAGKRQLVIGKDLSLVTIDDSQWAAAMTPGITVVARPVEELGQIAVDQLISEISQPDRRVEDIVLPTELIARGSVANLNKRPGSKTKDSKTKD